MSSINEADNDEQARRMIAQKISEVENAVQNIQTMREGLHSKANQMKQSILQTFMTRQTSMHAHEMSMLKEVDSALQIRDDSLITQLAKLNQVLGCMRNCLMSPHPCDECFEKFDDIDIRPMDEISMEFRLSSADFEPMETTQSSDDAKSSRTVEPALQLDTDLTQWLLTTRSPALQTSRPSSSVPKEATTPWLIHHVSGSGVHCAADFFESLKSDEMEAWLSPQSAGNAPSSGLFSNIQSFSQQEWLHKVQLRRSSRPVSVSDESGSVSSVQSSCVVIPSATSSEYSLPVNTTDKMQPAGSISLWVQRCEPLQDWLRPSAKPQAASDWLASSDSGSRASARNCVDIRDDVYALPDGAMDDWLIKPAVCQSELSDWLSEKGESHDEESDVTSSFTPRADWLIADDHGDNDSPAQLWLTDTSVKSMDKFIEKAKYEECVSDWLSGEEKTDNPIKYYDSASANDKEWLVVMDHMNKIAIGETHEWLAY